MDKENVIYEETESKLLYVKEASEEYKAEPIFTYEDYLTWPDDERWELIDGKAIRLESPSEYHQQISLNLSSAFHGYLTGKTCKAYSAPLDVCFHIDGKKDTVFQPDIFIVCDRTIIEEKRIKGTPDLVMEILSKSTTKHDKTEKLAKYEKHGVKEVWLIDPEKQEVLVYILNMWNKYNKPTIYRSSDDILQTTVLSKFKINLKNIFSRENVLNDDLLQHHREEGKEEGIEQERVKMAKSLKLSGMDIDEIAKHTGLSEATITRLG